MNIFAKFSDKMTSKLTAGFSSFLIAFSPNLGIGNLFLSLPISTNQTQLIASNQITNNAKTGTEINEISRQTTILIMVLDGNTRVGSGSGSIIAKEGNNCIAVTNRHVILSEEGKEMNLAIRTYDGTIYQGNKINKVYWFANEDLAVLEFQCAKNYQPIPLATYQLSPGQNVYVSGWPPSIDGTLNRQFTSGSISEIRETPIDGYAIGYTNVTQGGMSGGQVLDVAGRLIAIHGLGGLDRNTGQKTGFNYGIPVSTLLGRLSQNGLNYAYNVSYSSPQEPTNGSVVQSPEVPRMDSRDRVKVNDVMNQIEQGITLLCRFIRC